MMDEYFATDEDTFAKTWPKKKKIRLVACHL
jgi:hypothetical protein